MAHMSRGARAWQTWKRIASRAAEVQAHVLFFLMYFVAIAPVGVLRLGRSEAFAPDGQPRWKDHQPDPTTLATARRQF
jgi:hypothetical protein